MFGLILNTILYSLNFVKFIFQNYLVELNIVWLQLSAPQPGKYPVEASCKAKCRIRFLHSEKNPFACTLNLISKIHNCLNILLFSP